jgi:hypothetical protein
MLALPAEALCAGFAARSITFQNGFVVRPTMT